MVQATLLALFHSTNSGVVVRGFRSSSVPVTYKGFLVESRRPLWPSSGPHKLIALCTLSRHSPLAAVSHSTSIISLRLGSSASYSSPFSSPCYAGSHVQPFFLASLVACQS